MIVDQRSSSEFNGDFTHAHPEVVQERLEEIEEFAKVSYGMLHHS